jgi:hypothetical protein
VTPGARAQKRVARDCGVGREKCAQKWQVPPAGSARSESVGARCYTTPTDATTMNSFHPGESSSHPYREPAPLPASVPKVNELGATSAPLKSAAFFIGAYCKEYNGATSCIHGIISRPTQCMTFRGLHALQGGESRSRSLSEGGSTGNQMRN